MSPEQTYRTFFNLAPGNQILCENCGRTKNVQIFVIDPGVKADGKNLIALCEGCKDLKKWDTSIAVLRYMHRVTINRFERMLK